MIDFVSEDCFVITIATPDSPVAIISDNPIVFAIDDVDSVIESIATPDSPVVVMLDSPIAVMISDSDGSIVVNPPSIASAYWTATQIDLNSSTYYYYGGRSDQQWKINRYHKDSLLKQSATIANNPGYASLGVAWSDRISLSYGD